jgi:hypothetical protein
VPKEDVAKLPRLFDHGIVFSRRADLDAQRSKALTEMHDSLVTVVLDEMPVLEYGSVTGASSGLAPRVRRADLKHLDEEGQRKEIAAEQTRIASLRARNNEAAKLSRVRREALSLNLRQALADAVVEREYWKAQAIRWGSMPDDYESVRRGAARAYIPAPEEYKLMEEDAKHSQQHGTRVPKTGQKRVELLGKRKMADDEEEGEEEEGEVGEEEDEAAPPAKRAKVGDT